MLGVIMLGILGSKAINPAGADGLFYGGTGFFTAQMVTIVVSSIYAFGFTYFMLYLIDKVTPVRVAAADQKSGLDEAIHGEQAYEGI